MEHDFIVVLCAITKCYARTGLGFEQSFAPYIHEHYLFSKPGTVTKDCLRHVDRGRYGVFQNSMS